MSENQDLTTTDQPAATGVPSEHLAADGTDVMPVATPKAYLKIVQAQSDLRQEHKVGSVVATHGDVVHQIASGPDEPFPFVSLFAYTEFMIQNPPGSDEIFAARSLLPSSEIAHKARNPATRTEANGRKYVETLTYLCILPTIDELANVVTVMTFKSGSYMQGLNFNSLIRRRKADTGIGNTVQFRFEGLSTTRSNSMQSWYVIRAQNPSDGVLDVPEEDVLRYLEMQTELHAKYVQEVEIEKGLENSPY